MDTTLVTRSAALKGPTRWTLVVGAGIFATNLAQSSSLNLPLRDVLEGELHAPLAAISLFFAVATAPWYFKIIIGFLSDSIPIFGTTRRHYLLLSGTAAGALWLTAGYSPRSYLCLLATLTTMEAMLVVGSTVIGGLLVEAGQQGAARRLVAARNVVEGLCTVISGPLAGALAALPFPSAAAIGGLIAFTITPVAFIWLKEPAASADQGSTMRDLRDEMRRLLRSRPLWVVAAFGFIASMPQGFPTPLWDYQKHVMNLSDTTIGYLQGAGGAGSICAALVYGIAGRRLRLRALLILGTLGSAVGSIAYLFYTSLFAAIAVDAANGFLTTLWILAMMELAVWTTPRSAAAAGFALVMGAVNAGNQLGDYAFSSLIDARVVGFFGVAMLSAGAITLTLALLPLLPASGTAEPRYHGDSEGPLPA